MAVRLLALRAGRASPLQEKSWYSFLLEAESVYQETPSILLNKAGHYNIHVISHWFLFRDELIQSIPFQPVLSRSISILPSHQHLGFPRNASPTSLSDPNLYDFMSHACYIPSKSHAPSFRNPDNTFWLLQITKLLAVILSSLLSVCTVSEPMNP
jgi:hypothetical protein